MTGVAQLDEAPPASAPLVAALEASWAAIRARHPEVPAVVVVVGAGSGGAAAGGMKLGHFAAMRWRHGEQDVPEVFIGGEGLARGPLDVLGTLLHEAAHALAHAREVKDTSRQGRYHNRKYAALAKEVGLDVAEVPVIGWSGTTVRTDTASGYRVEVDALAAALTLWRHRELERPRGGRTSSNNPLPCTCDCGRRIRVAQATLDDGPILCGLCGEPFTPDAD